MGSATIMGHENDIDDTQPPKAVVAEINDHIGRKLKQMYDHITDQPVPDRFLDLLNQLDSKSSAQGE